MEATAQIGPSIRIKGNISAQEPLTIAGEVIGSIDVSGYHLVLTEAAQVDADVIARLRPATSNRILILSRFFLTYASPVPLAEATLA